MSWIKIDDGADNHPKIHALSGGAIRLWLHGLCHCARHLTDGLIPREKASGWAFEISMRTGNPGEWENLLSEMTNVPEGFEFGVWEACDEGFRIHDYLDYNPTRKKSELLKLQARERMKRLRSGERSREYEPGRSLTVRPVSSRSPSPSPSPVPGPVPSVEGQEGATVRAVAPWARTAARGMSSVSAERMQAAVCRCIREIRQATVYSARSGTSARELLGLWRAIGKPNVDEWAEQVCLVARAAQMSGNKLFSRDIRAEGWSEGTDRTNDVGTLSVQRRWDDRLSAAQDWERESGRRRGTYSLVVRRRWPDRGRPDAWEMLDPPEPVVVQYLEAAMITLRSGKTADKRSVEFATDKLSEVRESGKLDSSTATDIVAIVLQATGKW